MNHKDIPILTVTYLQNYVSDLRYQLAEGGADYVNYCTNETPEFDDDDKAKAYIARVESLASELAKMWDLDS
jgi:hypothetical protein